jgi:L-seryl-tRNA(Ser) seleniumtransferase
MSAAIGKPEDQVVAAQNARQDRQPGLRDLPSVDLLLQQDLCQEYAQRFGHALTVQALRQVLEDARQAYLAATPLTPTIPDAQYLLKKAGSLLESWTAPSLLPVINASGVVLHTNLGRAPLSKAAIEAVTQTAAGYSNLEFDLSTGRRGSRLVHAETLLQRLTGAEAALVVNNNAAAVVLILSALARRRGVIIPRSQLVEIGGGFRIPDVMKQSGCRLVEIGATNRVHLADYSQAIEAEKPALIMRAHRSNFRIVGFTTEPTLEEVTSLAHQAGLPVIDDLGSGAILDTAQYGLSHEPTVGESLAAGVDLVCFSGDKLLGGPQAGIIVGRAELVARLKTHPLARAIRADKLCLAALSATLAHYLKGEAEREIPIWRMIASSPEDNRSRALGWLAALDASCSASVQPSLSTVGGGSLPDENLASFVLALAVPSPAAFAARLRQANPAVVTRLENNLVILDPRTVLPEQEEELLSIVKSALADASADSAKRIST